LIVGSLSLELFLPECRSLKSKRRIIKSIQDKIRYRFNVSVAEVDHQDLWQRAGLGFACVGSSRKVVEKTLSGIVDFIEEAGCGEVIDIQREIL
jgi:uncharacterized protein YlxP (DUF503 family)